MLGCSDKTCIGLGVLVGWMMASIAAANPWFYSVDVDSDELVLIDGESGAIAPVGPLGQSVRPFAAMTTLSGRLYALLEDAPWTNHRLVEIDKSSGAILSAVHPTLDGIEVIGESLLTYNGELHMSVDPDQDTASQLLARINADGSLAVIADFSSAADNDLDGLVQDEASGEVYNLDHDGGSLNWTELFLVFVNPFPEQMLIRFYPAPGLRAEDPVIHDGSMYAVSYGPPRLLKVNVATGDVIQEITLSRNVRGLAITEGVIQPCCLPDAVCVEVDHGGCVALGGDPQGPGTTCTGTVCHPLKWSQPPLFDPRSPVPECFWGWDEVSWYFGPQIAADDWACTTDQPVTEIHWWGSYTNWPETIPPLPGPDFFHIGLWTDVPGSPDSIFASSNFDTGLDGWEPEQGVNLMWSATDGAPPGAAYLTDLDAPGPVIRAPAEYLGDWSMLDGVGEIRLDTRCVDPDGATITGTPRVALFGPGGRATYDWTVSASSEWRTYFAPLQAGQWYLNAGSWGGLLTNVTRMSVTLDFTNGNDTNALDNVIVSTGAGFSHPGTMFREWFVPRDELNERPVACDYHSGFMPNPEGCFRYDFRIPGPDWFYQEPACNIYWLSISAFYGGGSPHPFVWGWKTRPHFFQDNAVRVFNPTGPGLGFAYESGEPIRDAQGDSWDLAFVINAGPPSPPAPPLPAPAPHDATKNRYISFVPGDPNDVVALQLTCSKCPGTTMWVAAPTLMTYLDPPENDPAWVSRVSLTPVYRAWPEDVLQVGDRDIGPNARYELRATFEGVTFSDPLKLATTPAPAPAYFGDIVGRRNCQTNSWDPPQGVLDILDIGAMIDKFKRLPLSIHTTRADLIAQFGPPLPDDPNYLINFFDIAREVDAFKGLSFVLTGEYCQCSHCSDGIFCNGLETCALGGWCGPGTDPCPRTICNEAAQTCDACPDDAACRDSIFCNGAERCVAGVCIPGSYPCGTDICDESAGVCGPTTAIPLFDWRPVSATGTYCFDGDTLVVQGGGQDVTLELYLSNWDPDLNGAPALGSYQGTIEPSGYLGEGAVPPNPGVDLTPVGWPSDPESGAFVDQNRSDFVMEDPAATWALSYRTLDYYWGAAGSTSRWPGNVVDPGGPRYAGTLILSVPNGAHSTYSIAPDPNDDRMFLTDPRWCRLPRPAISAAQIRVADMEPRSPLPDPSAIARTRFLSFGVRPEAVGQTALRVQLLSLHNVEPPYTSGTAADFSAYEGQYRWVGPPVRYLESVSSGVLFWGAKLQCTPYYTDWSTVGLVHVTGPEILPSSVYNVQVFGAVCQENEATCAAVSCPLEIRTTRWGDVENPYNPPSSTTQPDTADISALVNKFKSAVGAPIKARALLAGQVPDMVPDLSFAHISACVDAFKGLPYPYSGPCVCPSTVACDAIACSPQLPCPTGQVCKGDFCRDACERCTP